MIGREHDLHVLPNNWLSHSKLTSIWYLGPLIVPFYSVDFYFRVQNNILRKMVSTRKKAPKQKAT